MIDGKNYQSEFEIALTSIALGHAKVARARACSRPAASLQERLLDKSKERFRSLLRDAVKAIGSENAREALKNAVGKLQAAGVITEDALALADAVHEGARA